MAHYKGKQVQYVSSPPRISGICAANTVMPKCRRLPSGSPLFSDESSAGLVFSAPSAVRAATVNFSSLCGAMNDNDPGELECGSEEGLEALAEEMNANTNLSITNTRRNPSKRSRAAEVHNLSEKRRRSRINEKMKALQNLIPNSNKTDKASMLDDAIEYLKQLQLQVQMLSMRNGLSLHPNQPSNSNLSNMLNSESCFGLEQSTNSHLGSFQLHPTSEVINREAKLLHQQPNVNFADTNPLASK